MKKWIIRLVIVAVVLVVAAGVVLFLNLNSVVKKGVETVGPEITQVQIKLGGVSLSPLSGNGTLSDLFVGNPTDYKTPSAIKVGELKVAVQVRSVFKDTVVIDQIAISNPEITFEGNPFKNNLKQIQANVEAFSGKSSGTDAKSQKKFQVRDLTIQGAKVNISVTGMGGKSLTLPVPDIHLQNIGTENQAVTAAELTKQVLGQLVSNVTKVATEALSKLGALGKDAVKGVGDQLDKSTKGIKGLFGK